MKELLTVFKGLLVVFSILAPAGLAFADSDLPRLRTISVTGEAKDEVAPDQAVLSVSLVSKDKDLNTAKSNNDAMVERVVVIAKDHGITKGKLSTSNLYISPEYSFTNLPQGTGKQVLIGYIVSRSLRITIDDLSHEEMLLSAIVAAKVDQVNGVEFQLADKEAYTSKLRVKAFADAKAQATALAEAAGVKLGAPLTISTNGTMGIEPMPFPRMMMASKGAESVAPSLPGHITLQENVQVTFGIE